MRFAKIILGLLLVVIVGGLVAGLVALIRKPSGRRVTSFDTWPDVPSKPTTAS